MKHNEQLREKEQVLEQKEKLLDQTAQEQKRREMMLRKSERNEVAENRVGSGGAVIIMEIAIQRSHHKLRSSSVSNRRADDTHHRSMQSLRKNITELCSLNVIFSSRDQKPVNELIDAIDVIESDLAVDNSLRRCVLLYRAWLHAEEGWTLDARDTLRQLDITVLDDDDIDNPMEHLACGVLAA